MIKVIIFDFDGVILDTNKAKGLAFVETFSSEKSIIKKKIYNTHIENIGISRKDKIILILKSILKVKYNKKKLVNLLDKFSKIVFKKVIKSGYILGAKNFILNNHLSYDFHISTATPKNEIFDILQKKKIIKYFKSINGSPDSKISHIQKIIKNGKYKKKEVLFIGDSDNDLYAARKNNIKFFGIINEFNNFKIKYKFKNFIEIEKFLRKN